jgi:hypothetical protein
MHKVTLENAHQNATLGNVINVHKVTLENARHNATLVNVKLWLKWKLQLIYLWIYTSMYSEGFIIK